MRLRDWGPRSGVWGLERPTGVGSVLGSPGSGVRGLRLWVSGSGAQGSVVLGGLWVPLQLTAVVVPGASCGGREALGAGPR